LTRSYREVGLLLGACVLVYANALGGTFHYDDFHSLVHNPSLRSLDFFLTYFSDPAAFSADPGKAMYRPLLLLSYGFNYAVGGGYHPVVFLCFNLVVHLGCVLAVWDVGRRMGEENAMWAALLFALHPLASEPVNYVSSRSESLAALGVLVAFGAYLRQRTAWDWVAGVCFVAALLSKSIAVVLPVLLLAYEYHKGEPRHWRRLVPYFVTALAYVWLLWYLGFLGSSLAAAPRAPGLQWITQLKAWVYYFWLAVMPAKQNVEHAFVVARLQQWAPWLAAGALFSLGWVVWRIGGRRRFWAIWVAVSLLPASIVPLNVLVNEHRLYLGGVGLAFLAAGALAARRRLWVALLLVCAVLTWQRNAVWQSETSLWTDAAAKAPSMPRVHVQLGHALRQEGRNEAAHAAFSRALALDPEHRAARTNLANLLYEKAMGLDDRPLIQEQELQKAALQFGVVLALDPGYAEALNGLGSVYMGLGRLAEAQQAYGRLVQIRPNFPQGYYNLGLVAARREEWAAAAQHYNRALELDGQAETAKRLGDAWAKLGRLLEADQAYGQAATAWTGDLSLWLNWGEVQLVLGQSRLDGGDKAGAFEHWRRATLTFTKVLSQESGNPRARQRLAQLQAVMQ
jgi:protein O-mannosyl-transferase